MKRFFQIAAVLVAGLALTACEEVAFDDQAAHDILEADKVPLSGEVVILNPDQVICGEKKGLWTVDQLETGGGIARLTAEGRALHFADDIRMGDLKYSGPYTQLTGSLPIKVQNIDKITDEKANVKVIQAKVGVTIDDACFTKPIALLGIRRGDFSEDVNPRFRIRQGSDWVVEQVLH